MSKLAEKEGLEKLYEEAKNIDEEAMTKISPNDKKRIIRVLEIYHKTGKTKTEREMQSIVDELQSFNIIEPKIN